MAHKVVQGGDSWNVKAGTREQTGNHAPRVQWPYAVRVLILLIAYRLGYTDDRMGIKREFPSVDELGQAFLAALPEFPVWYNAEQARLVAEAGYNGPAEPFHLRKVYGRLQYCFTVPGRLKRTRHRGPSDRPIERRYGVVGPEHPKHPSQHTAGGRDIWARCSDEIEHRLTHGNRLTMAEMLTWSRTEPAQPSLLLEA